MGYETILYDKAKGIGTITLNRPERMNALNLQAVKELNEVLDEIEGDEEVRSVIITGGQEKFFCSGADIRDETSLGAEFIPALRKALAAIEASGKPFIGAISGLALGGGCELSLVCDLRIAADNAQIGLPEILVGAFPGAGATDRLPRLIGMTKAKEMIFLGKHVDANEAYRIGLVNKVVPVGSLMDEAKETAKSLAEKSPFVLKMDKYAINAGMMMDLQSSLHYSWGCVTIVMNSEDMREGMRAFAEKRKPVWKAK